MARAPRRRLVVRTLGVAALAAALVFGVLPVRTHAAAGDTGYEGISFSGTSTPTGQKRSESILWWNDGSWWASMWDSVSADFEIFKLDVTTQRWTSTNVRLDPRANTHADVLWDERNQKLYVASHKYANDETLPTSGWPAYLYRYSYDRLSDTYTPDTGFPVQINNYNSETLVIDKDSTGTLWATWMQDSRIYVSRTLSGDDRAWGTPFVLPVDGATVTADDNSSIIAFGGNKIGVMWSNQVVQDRSAVYFAVHQDGDPAQTWEASKTAIQGPRDADDHINLKALQADDGGRIYAAVKTEHVTSSSPLIMLLVRDAATGSWVSHSVGKVSECHNRPTVLIDEERSMLHVFATAPSSPQFSCNTTGGSIYTKTSPLNNIAFAPGYGTVVLHDADSAAIHNASSTKQNVNSRTGLVVLASNGKTARYWHHYDALTSVSPSAPTADFSATPRSGDAPLTVSFTDSSTGTPTSWTWSFGDGSRSTAQHPSHTYTTPGTYTVALTVANGDGSNTNTKTVSGFISVGAPPPDFAIAATPTKQTVVRGNSTTYKVDVVPFNGFAGSVAFAPVTGLPPGATATFSPTSVSGAGSTTLTVQTSASTKVGGHTLRIVGASGSLTRATTVSLQIKQK